MIGNLDVNEFLLFIFVILVVLSVLFVFVFFRSILHKSREQRHTKPKDTPNSKVEVYQLRGDGRHLSFYWSGNGFGEIRIFQEKDGNIVIDSEYMSKEFVKRLLCNLVDNAEIRE